LTGGFYRFKSIAMFTVYVLYSDDYDKIYIGYTSNLEQRLLSHNKSGKKSCPLSQSIFLEKRKMNVSH